MGDTITIKKRRLPHWETRGATYFLTIRAKTEFTPPERIIIAEHIKSGAGIYYSLACFVVMPDHMHIILKPNSGISLRRLLSGIKGVSARKVNLLRGTTGQVWQHESFDRIIRNNYELKQKFHYVKTNPERAGLVSPNEHYAAWYGNTNILSAPLHFITE